MQTPASFAAHHYDTVSRTIRNYAVSLPLDCPRRLDRHIVNDAGHALHIVDDARRTASEEGVVEGIALGRHPIGRGNATEREDTVTDADDEIHTHQAHE